MAEAHPVGFQWVMEAKARGAKIIHIDPRFSRTSAMADMFVPVRAGADIAFVGGLVNYVLTHEKYFHEYVLNYTNASVILSEDYADTEDLDGVFSGLDREHKVYDHNAWRYEGFEPGAGKRRPRRGVGRRMPDPRGGPRRGARVRRRGRAPHPGDRRDAPAPALRLPGAQAALRALHAGDGGADRRGARGRLPGKSAS